MSKALDLVAAWRECTSYYEGLIADFGARLRSMTALTQQIAASNWATQLFPSTSMEALGLSRHATYVERMEDRMVYIAFDERQGSFSVHFQDPGGRDISIETAASIAPELWDRISEWLGVTP